jgi:hypothetical protein
MRRTIMQRRVSLFAFVSLLAVSAATQAGTVVCSGTVEAISYHANDLFMVRLSSMNLPVYFCNPEVAFTPAPGYTTGPQTCKALYAMFLSARLTGTPVNNVYFDGPNVPATCDTWGSWVSANIRHFVY